MASELRSMSEIDFENKLKELKEFVDTPQFLEQAQSLEKWIQEHPPLQQKPIVFHFYGLYAHELSKQTPDDVGRIQSLANKVLSGPYAGAHDKLSTLALVLDRLILEFREDTISIDSTDPTKKISIIPIDASRFDHFFSRFSELADKLKALPLHNAFKLPLLSKIKAFAEEILSYSAKHTPTEFRHSPFPEIRDNRIKTFLSNLSLEQKDNPLTHFLTKTD